MIYNFLDASTGYITEKDNEILLSGKFESELVVISHKYGFWVSVPEIGFNVICKKNNLSIKMIELLKYAQSKDCVWINLDCDGDTDISELVFEQW